MSEAREMPRTKLWGNRADGYVVVLECDCGAAVYYPGHPDERTSVTCDQCGAVWKLAEK